MNNLVVDKAQEAANESFEGKQDQLGRGKRVKRKLMDDINDASINVSQFKTFVIVNNLMWCRRNEH